MKYIVQFLLVVFLIPFVSCGRTALEKTDDVQKNEKKEVRRKEIPEKEFNNIFVKENGLIVKDLYLTREDSSVVTSTNKPRPTEKVKLHLYLEGWSVKDGRVKVGASETITASNGMDILSMDDVFSKVPDLSEKGAKYIKLTAKITEPGTFDYFTVSFKVWDKASNASITGHYKLDMN